MKHIYTIGVILALTFSVLAMALSFNSSKDSAESQSPSLLSKKLQCSEEGKEYMEDYDEPGGNIFVTGIQYAYNQEMDTCLVYWTEQNYSGPNARYSTIRDVATSQVLYTSRSGEIGCSPSERSCLSPIEIEEKRDELFK